MLIIDYPGAPTFRSKKFRLECFPDWIGLLLLVEPNARGSADRYICPHPLFCQF